MDRVLHFVLALAVVAILALLVSSDRKKIRIRYVIQLLVIEVLLAWFFLNSDVGLGFVKGFSEMFEKLLGFANEGTNFVFGSMNDQGLAFFFLKGKIPNTQTKGDTNLDDYDYGIEDDEEYADFEEYEEEEEQ